MKSFRQEGFYARRLRVALMPDVVILFSAFCGIGYALGALVTRNRCAIVTSATNQDRLVILANIHEGIAQIC